MVVAYILIGRVISDRSYKAAYEASDISCAMLRTLVHYLHALGIAKEAVRLDANRYMAILSIPLDFLIRPVEMAQVDCLLMDGGFVTGYARPTLFLIPFAVFIVFLCHLTESIVKWLVLAMRASLYVLRFLIKGS